MSAAATPVWIERNRTQLLGEFARLRGLLGVEASAAEARHWDCEAPPAIETLCAIFGLSRFERDLLLLCAGVEMESDLGEACGRLTGRPQHRCPTFGLGMSLLPEPHWNALAPWAPLRRSRLIEVEPGFGLAAAPLRIDERVLHYLAGTNQMDPRLERVLHGADARAPLAEEHEDLVERIANEFDGRPAAMSLHLHGDDPQAQETIAARVAERFGRRLFVLRIEDTPSLGADLEQFLALWSREALLLPACLLLAWEGEAPNANARALAERVPSPLLIASRDPQTLHRLTWRHEVSKQAPATQRALWKQALAEAGDKAGSPPATAFPERKRSPLAVGRDAGQDVRAVPAERRDEYRRSRRPPSRRAAATTAGKLESRLWNSCRSVSRPQLDLLAERIEPRAGWDDLVLPEAQLAVLRMLVSQARHRMTVYERWGFARSGRRGLGISALFAGPSGTGKTLAAEVLAARARARPLPHRPVRRRQQIHRRDREEPEAGLRCGRAGRRGAAVRRGGRAVRQAHRGQGQPRSLRQYRGGLPAAAHGELSGRRDPDHQPAKTIAGQGLSAPAALHRGVSLTPARREREAIWRRAIPAETPRAWRWIPHGSRSSTCPAATSATSR